MRANIRDIRELLGCDEETALQVEAQMEDGGIDFSECTRREFTLAALEARDVL